MDKPTYDQLVQWRDDQVTKWFFHELESELEKPIAAVFDGKPDEVDPFRMVFEKGIHAGLSRILNKAKRLIQIKRQRMELK